MLNLAYIKEALFSDLILRRVILRGESPAETSPYGEIGGSTVVVGS